MQVIEQTEKLRLIKSAGKYSVQGLSGFLFWKKWRNISFGPYYPQRCGYSRFKFKSIAYDLYKECVNGDYSSFEFNWRYGIK
jgi:hypothetical protein